MKLINIAKRITRNIANGWEWSKLEHFSPLRAFVSVDRNALRKPPLAILPPLWASKKTSCIKNRNYGNTSRV